jgi:hypothetical protein
LWTRLHLLGEVLIGHDVINEIVGQIPNIWDKMKKPLHGKKEEHATWKREEAVACYMQRGKRDVAIEHYMAEVE